MPDDQSQRRAQMELLWKDLRELAKRYDVPIICTKQQKRSDGGYVYIEPQPGEPAVIFYDYLDVLR